MTIIEIFTNGGEGPDRYSFLAVIAFVLGLLIALVLHEIAHGVAAYYNGDNTAKMYGRFTLNPLKHFDTMGLVLMLICGFGWAKPVPVNPNNFKNYKRGCIMVSLAGVVTNLVLAFIFAAFSVFGWAWFIKSEGGYFPYLIYALGFCTMGLNINFALFNLLPLYPLDGYRLMACFVDENKSYMVFLRKYSLYIMLGLVLLSNFSFLSFISPLTWYLGKFGGLIQKLFTGFWGLFI